MKFSKNEYLHLFSCCLLIKGYRRSIIIDFQRRKIESIPNSLHSFITNDIDLYSLPELAHKFKEQNSVFKEYLDFLLSKEICFICNSSEKKLFPTMSIDWDFPSIVSNSIIEIFRKKKYNIQSAIKKLNELRCFHIELRIKKDSDFNKSNLVNCLKFINNLSFHSISLVLDNTAFSKDDLIFLCKEFLKINTIIIFNSPKDESEKISNVIFIYTKINISNCHCGAIDTRYFSQSIDHFTESQHHNTCLNRKVCIDINGEIKNCPSLNKNFGNIRNTTLAEAIEKPGFKDLWFINKDKVDVCKDCEFRHMCTDCRAFIKDPENIYSQPSKCPYNPYIAKWQREEGYVSVEECGAYKREKGFVVNKRKVNKLNK